MKRLLFLLFLFSVFTPVSPQGIYYHTSNTGLYLFLDELCNARIIGMNTAIKPYTRQFIAQQLNEAGVKREYLNRRQIAELDFYLKDFNKELIPDSSFKKRLDLIYRRDSLFTITLNPILGIRYWVSRNGSVYHRWNGAEAFASIGDHWGFYASLRDNHESERLAEPEYLTQRPGAAYKTGDDYSEMRGGITYSWKWGTIALIKDHFTWGDNYNGANIFSGRTPSFVQIKLQLKPAEWFEFNYIHGWLVSGVVDSTRTWYYTNIDKVSVRKAYREKYMAANFFTFKPWDRLYISFGNSIIYSDTGFEPSYFVPFFFFKSVDHTINQGIDNQNSQMFINISSRQIRNIHLYTSFFVDEVSIKNMFSPSEHSNLFSWKMGGRLENSLVSNLSLTAEYTRTWPLAFKHYLPTVTFESNHFNLGHYLQDNADEIYLDMQFKPFRCFLLDLSFTNIRKGPDYSSLTTERHGLPFMETPEWTYKQITLKIYYQIINDAYIFSDLSFFRNTGDDHRYLPSLLRGNGVVASFGLHMGL